MSIRALSVKGDQIRVPSAAFDHTGFRTWATSDDYPQNLRSTFVDSEVLLEMSPEELETHNKVKQAITVTLVSFVEEHDLGEGYSDGVLVSHLGAGLSCEPDLTFISWASWEQGRVRRTQKVGRPERFVEIEGTPDLVVEVVSDSSVRKDNHLLREAYLRAGIAEYWLVDARGDSILFQILQNQGKTFHSIAGWGQPQASAVLGGRWTLSRTRNRAGGYRYRLEPLP
jgi:Uma2 family endonuclease